MNIRKYVSHRIRQIFHICFELFYVKMTGQQSFDIATEWIIAIQYNAPCPIIYKVVNVRLHGQTLLKGFAYSQGKVKIWSMLHENVSDN